MEITSVSCHVSYTSNDLSKMDLIGDTCAGYSRNGDPHSRGPPVDVVPPLPSAYTFLDIISQWQSQRCGAVFL